MFCNQCGAKLTPGSRFCNSCGAALPAGQSAPPPTAQGVPNYAAGYTPSAPTLGPIADEHNIFTLRPTLIFVMVWYAIATVLLLVVAALLGWLKSAYFKDMSNGIAFIVILIVALVIYAIPLYKHFLRRREVYVLTNHKLEMRYGIIAKTVRNIPLAKIQDVTVTASVWQRLLKLGDIEIDSASEGGKIVLDEVHNPEHYANIILTELRRVK
ncbi:MAG: PH domain-containing protein [Acidobacteriota bacterium]